MTIAKAQHQPYVDLENGLVDRRIFVDNNIYQLELEQIFARAWNFVCHDSQIPNPGDFFMTFIGEDRVIVVRDNDMKPQVLINSCRHRGNAVCRAEEGHATSFMCTYHGWTYDLKGALVGVPGFKEVYHEELDRENWGLIRAAQVHTYKGFVFATMDETAPSLREYLGTAGRMNLDLFGDDVVAFEGLTKYTINANWKFPQDNTWDQYHGPVTHAAPRFLDAYGSAPRRPDGTLDMRKQFDNSVRYKSGETYIGEYGHAMTGIFRADGLTDEDRQRSANDRRSRLGGGTRNIFPNVFMGGGDLELRIPKGPLKTEIWMWGFVEKGASTDARAKVLHRHQHTFGPAGMHEQDDGENWDQSTRGAQGVVSRRFPLHYAMGLGRGELIPSENGPPVIDNFINEHGQLWHYRVWEEMIRAESWDDYRKTHSVPSGRL